MSTVIIFILIILTLVVIHELGHFFVAKAFKIRVDEFGVGYPPRAKKLFTWKGTLFSLNWLPFGGFVKIYGEDAQSGIKEEGTFYSAKLYQKLLVLLAGVIANILLAFVLYTGSFLVGFLGFADEFPNAHVIDQAGILVTGTQKDSPADISGILAGDKIIGISEGENSIAPKTISELTNFIASYENKELTIKVDRNNEEKIITAVPQKNSYETPAVIGVSIISADKLRLPFGDAVILGAKTTVKEFVSTIRSIGIMLKSLINPNTKMVGEVSGPVGIAKFAGIALSFGFGTLLSFSALISINLAVINLFPFPALDGGRFILEIINRNGRSKIGTRIVSIVNQVGFIILLLLMVYVTYKDILRIAS